MIPHLMQACRDTLHPIFYTIKWFWESAKFIKREISNEELIEATIKGLGGAISGKNTFLTNKFSYGTVHGSQ